MDKRKTEKLINIAFSAYTLVLTAAAAVLGWPAWIIPVIISEMMITITTTTAIICKQAA